MRQGVRPEPRRPGWDYRSPNFADNLQSSYTQKQRETLLKGCSILAKVAVLKTPEMPTFPSDSPDCHGLRDAKGLHRDGPSRCKPPCRPNRYNHDLDSRETEYRTHRPGPAAMVKVSRASNKQGQLNPRYERLARHLRAQQEQRPKANKNRRRASRSAEKQVGYKLPQIVVVQEPTHGRRVGGL